MTTVFAFIIQFASLGALLTIALRILIGFTHSEIRQLRADLLKYIIDHGYEHENIDLNDYIK